MFDNKTEEMLKSMSLNSDMEFLSAERRSLSMRCSSLADSKLDSP